MQFKNRQLVNYALSSQNRKTCFDNKPFSRSTRPQKIFNKWNKTTVKNHQTTLIRKNCKKIQSRDLPTKSEDAENIPRSNKHNHASISERTCRLKCIQKRIVVDSHSKRFVPLFVPRRVKGETTEYAALAPRFGWWYEEPPLIKLLPTGPPRL